jgi:predicted Zn-dependent protease
MRALEVTPLAVAIALLGWVGVQAKRSASRPAPAPSAVAVAGDARTTGLVEGPASAPANVQLAGGTPSGVTAANLDEERLRVLRRIDLSAEGTFIKDHLADQDSTIVRWVDASGGVRVWIQAASAVAGFQPQYVHAARDAFGEWKAAGFPVAFVFVVDSAAADIVIGWTDRFPEHDGQQVGHTRRMFDAQHVIRGAEVLIAIHDSAGTLLPQDVVAAVARHEVGHALGLGHSTDSTTLMFPSSHTLRISEKDRQTLRLLYMLPTGPLR